MVGRRKKDLTYLGVCIAGLLLLNIVSSFFFERFDFTTEKRYTLSENTKVILSQIKEPLQVTVYLEGDFPAGFKRLRNFTSDLLTDYKAYSDNRIRYDFINPSSGDQETQQQVYQDLVEKGLEPTNLTVDTESGRTQKIIFPSALITYEGKQIAVNLFQNKQNTSPEEVLNNSIRNVFRRHTKSYCRFSCSSLSCKTCWI